LPISPERLKLGSAKLAHIYFCKSSFVGDMHSYRSALYSIFTALQHSLLCRALY